MFEYYVSLGDACSVASSMSKYGLRSFSGVFDWLVTMRFNWVLYYMETDFKDFLQFNNLERYDGDIHHFRDKESHFLFIHDDECFESEYRKLKDKYDRRIKNFLEKTKSRTCYLRSIHNMEEFEYVCNNASYINSVIHKNNSDSEIVFLCNSDLQIGDDFEFRYYKLQEVNDVQSRIGLRSYFDCSDDFLEFCGENFLGSKLIKNLSFDYEKEIKSQLLQVRRYKTLITLLEHDFSNYIFSDKTIIYGGGVIGRELYKKIKHLTRVICFVDNKKYGSKFEGIEIVSESEMYNGGGGKSNRISGI